METEPLKTLKPSHGKQTQLVGKEIKEEFHVEIEEEHFILCRTCGNRITTLDRIIAVNDLHRHTFTNPAGITYEIGCFSAAEGCIVSGYPTYEFTWFPGFDWSLAFCSRCITHLGWYYESSGKRFYGLIVEHLIESIRTH